jgi:release factor glutamine methyltransferase
VRAQRTEVGRNDDPSVYPPREDTELLLPFADAGPGQTVLEIGTGSGAIAERVAASGTRVLATDLNPAALRRLHARGLRSEERVELVRTDLAAGLRRFDRILANPPYLPTPVAARDPDRWVNLALDGGPDGCATWARIVDSLGDHLAPGGAAFVLESSRQDRGRREEARLRWRASGGTVRLEVARDLGDEQLQVWSWRLGSERP